jgi:ABC-type multidrug transport system fused ATPase/permease subunit
MMAVWFEPWRQYWQILSGCRLQAMLAATLVAVSGFFEVLSMLSLTPILEALAPGSKPDAGDLERLVQYLAISSGQEIKVGLVLFAAFGLLSALLRLFSEAKALRIRAYVEVETRERMAEALLDVDWQRFIALRQGEIAKSLLMEGNQIAYGVRLFVMGLGTLLATFTFLLMAWWISPEMTSYTLAFGAGAAFVYRAASRPVRRNVEHLSRLLGSIGTKVTDVFGNLKFIRASGRSATAREESANIFREFADASYRSQIYSPALRAFFEIAVLVFIAVFLYWRLFVNGDPASTVLIFMAVFYRLSPKILAVQDYFFQARTYLPWFESWKKRLDFALSSRQATNGSEVPIFTNELCFDRVSFSYVEGRPVIADISLSVRPGECVAIVGASGGGKSTLLDLTTGLLRPSSGCVSVDGRPLDKLDREAWCQRIGLVMQESPLFHTSVLANIAWGDPAPNAELAIDCARRAHAWDFIESLPEGLNTVIGERGARLSGGQRQRLGIARALYRQPALLILDEATSALDGEAESVVQSALEELKGRFAILMVAHRLKTVRMADRIIVLVDGHIAEQGSWDELAQRGEIFSEMLAQQGMVL